MNESTKQRIKQLQPFAKAITKALHLRLRQHKHSPFLYAKSTFSHFDSKGRVDRDGEVIFSLEWGFLSENNHDFSYSVFRTSQPASFFLSEKLPPLLEEALEPITASSRIIPSLAALLPILPTLTPLEALTLFIKLREWMRRGALTGWKDSHTTALQKAIKPILPLWLVEEHTYALLIALVVEDLTVVSGAAASPLGVLL